MTETFRTSIDIEATPDRVFDHFVQPELLVQWMGDAARLEAVDGGVFSVDINGVLIRGHFVQIDRLSRASTYARHRECRSMGIDQTTRTTMPKYLCLQRALPGGDQEADRTSPSQMQAMYAKFTEWRQKFQDNLVDLGGRLGHGSLVTAERVPDGPLVEVKELVGGYMIVSAASLDEAIEIARGCPGLCDPVRAWRSSRSTRRDDLAAG